MKTNSVTNNLSANEQKLKSIITLANLGIMPTNDEYFWLSDMAQKIGGIYQIAWDKVKALEEQFDNEAIDAIEELDEPLYWDEY